MIKTYDEALKTLNDVRKYLDINRADDCVEELDKVARYFINEKHSQPTLLECIKKWEERGYEVWHHNKENVIEFDKYDKSNGHLFFLGKIEIDLDDKEYWSDLYFNLEECHLLTKTLKALEEIKDD
jgi:hypothetical protein